MDYKTFNSLLRLAVYVLGELKDKPEMSVLYVEDENVFRIVFSKTDNEVFDFLIFDNKVEKPVLFGEGFEDSGTGRFDNEDFFIQDLLEIFYSRDDFSLN